ncbi:hypothetical protein JYU29_17620 [Tianweitania sp. BSSL-BM11]|uniref:DUF3426 domain-containing protein n=1 Tax=Tianweitania aestuarii TaxID=2814886 RepID=A0ABS5S3L0_9HYPH|nr:hypothetical protein [Tianweitania aestuarii]MBS9722517.1 hypothetical protein [Tianweitania aestuarii]
MTAAVRRGLPKPVVEVVNAEIIDVADEPSSAPPLQPRPNPTFAVLQNQPQPKTAQRGGMLFWTAGLTLIASAFWISGGHTLAPGAFAMGSPVKLAIAHVESRVQTHTGHSTLMVDGEARNDGTSVAAMPPIAITVTGPDGAVTHYTLSTNAQPVAAGDLYLFSSRLRVPPGGVKSVAVTLKPAE